MGGLNLTRPNGLSSSFPTVLDFLPRNPVLNDFHLQSHTLKPIISFSTVPWDGIEDQDSHPMHLGA